MTPNKCNTRCKDCGSLNSIAITETYIPQTTKHRSYREITMECQNMIGTKTKRKCARQWKIKK